MENSHIYRVGEDGEMGAGGAGAAIRAKCRATTPRWTTPREYAQAQVGGPAALCDRAGSLACEPRFGLNVSYERSFVVSERLVTSGRYCPVSWQVRLGSSDSSRPQMSGREGFFPGYCDDHVCEMVVLIHRGGRCT